MDMAVGKLFLEITHFYNSFIMHYTQYFTLRDCSEFLQIRSHFVTSHPLAKAWMKPILQNKYAFTNLAAYFNMKI